MSQFEEGHFRRIPDFAWFSQNVALNLHKYDPYLEVLPIQELHSGSKKAGYPVVLGSEPVL